MTGIEPGTSPKVERVNGRSKFSVRRDLRRETPTKEAISSSVGMEGTKIINVHFTIDWNRRGRMRRSSSETNKYRKSVYKRSGSKDVDAGGKTYVKSV